MRELTQEEVDNAPGWATHYLILKNSSKIRFTDGKKFIYGFSSEAILLDVPCEIKKPLKQFKPIPSNDVINQDKHFGLIKDK